MELARMTSNQVSVVIPVYNGLRYLAVAIESVLAQNPSPAEIIVVDDGSTDGGGAVARAFGSRVCVLTQANRGPAAARNLGVAHASGDLLAFLDADDLWLFTKLARQMQVLQDDPLCEAVIGGVENFISPELGNAQRRLLARAAAQRGDVHVGALLIRREAFQRIGDFDTHWRHGEFIAWWARAARMSLHYAVLPELVLRRRLHVDNLTRRERYGQREYPTMLREHIRELREKSVKHYA
jgi:glycosyltransferase involved in cell wall biosynthesis